MSSVVIKYLLLDGLVLCHVQAEMHDLSPGDLAIFQSECCSRWPSLMLLDVCVQGLVALRRV